MFPVSLSFVPSPYQNGKSLSPDIQATGSSGSLKPVSQVFASSASNETPSSPSPITKGITPVTLQRESKEGFTLPLGSLQPKAKSPVCFDLPEIFEGLKNDFKIYLQKNKKVSPSVKEGAVSSFSWKNTLLIATTVALPILGHTIYSLREANHSLQEANLALAKEIENLKSIIASKNIDSELLGESLYMYKIYSLVISAIAAGVCVSLYFQTRQLKELEDDKSKAQKNIDDVKKDIEKLNKELEEKNKHESAQKTLNDSLQQDIENKKHKITKLSQDSKKLEQEVKELKEKSDRSAEENRCSQQELAKVKEELAKLEQDKAESEQHSREIQSKLESLQEESDKVKQQLASSQNELAHANHQLREVRTSKEEIVREVAKLKEEISINGKKIIEKEILDEEQKLRIYQLEDNLCQTEELKLKLENELKESKSSLESKNTELEKIKEIQGKWDVEIIEYGKLIAQIQKNAEDRSQIIERFENLESVYEEKIKVLEAKIHELESAKATPPIPEPITHVTPQKKQKSLKELSKEVQKRTEQRRKLRSKLNSLKAKASKQEAELAEIKEKILNDLNEVKEGFAEKFRGNELLKDSLINMLQATLENENRILNENNQKLGKRIKEILRSARVSNKKIQKPVRGPVHQSLGSGDKSRIKRKAQVELNKVDTLNAD